MVAAMLLCLGVGEMAWQLFGGEVFAIQAKTGVTDQTTGGNNVTYNGGMGAVDSVRAVGFVFDGTDDHLTVPAGVSVALGGGSGMTLSAWILKTSTATGGTVFNVAVSGSTVKLLVDFTAGNTLRVGGRSVAADSFQSISTTFSIAEYAMLTAVLDAANDEILIYRNGALLSSGSVSFSASTVTTDGAAGRIGDASFSGRFGGLIDEVRLWNSPLSAADISDLYDFTLDRFSGGGGASFPLIGPGGLVY
jgi:hypothetical protein